MKDRVSAEKVNADWGEVTAITGVKWVSLPLAAFDGKHLVLSYMVKTPGSVGNLLPCGL